MDIAVLVRDVAAEIQASYPKAPTNDRYVSVRSRVLSYYWELECDTTRYRAARTERRFNEA